MDELFLYFDTSVDQYALPMKITLADTCNGITFKNLGTTLLLVDADVLQPGQSKSFGGNRGEIYRGRHDIAFQTQTVAPPVVTNLVAVTQKYYVKPGPGQKKYYSEL